MSTRLQDALGAWVEFCERRPRSVLLAIGIASALLAVYVAGNFAIDSDLGKLIKPSEALGWYRADEAYKAAFPELQQTSIVVVSGMSLADVDASAQRLVRAFEADGRFEYVFAPALEPMLRDHRAYFLTNDELDQWISGVQYDYGAMLRLADAADLSNAAFTMADQVSATDGLRLPTLLASIAQNFRAAAPSRLRLAAYPHLEPETEADHYLIIMLKGQQVLDQRLPNASQVALIRNLAEATELEPGVRVRLTGEVPLAHEEISAALDGIGIAGTVSLVLLAIILRVGVRSWRIIAVTFALLGVGVLWTLGYAIFTVGAFNTLALIFVVMFFGLGVDFAVHFALRFWESMAPDSTDDPEVHAAREVGPALLLCMVTSSIAFLSFAPTDYRGLGELGIISAGGMVIAFALTLSLIPAWFAVVGLPAPESIRHAGIRMRWQLRPVIVLSLTVAVAAAATWIARDLRFDYSVLALRDADTEAMSTLLELQENAVTTDYSINVLAADAAAAAGLKAQLLTLAETGQVLIPGDLVPAEQARKHAALSGLGALLTGIDPVQPGDPEFAAEGLAEAIGYLREVRSSVQASDQALFDDFVSGLEALQRDPERLAKLNEDLRQGLEAELATLRRIAGAAPFGMLDLPADLRARLISTEGRHLVTVMPAQPIIGRDATEAFVRAVMSVTPDVAGRAVVEWGVGEVAVRSFIEAVVVAVSAIAVLLVIYFRGVVLPLVVMIPLALTTLITFAIIELAGLSLNMANILVIPLIFGLGVDTGIHVVHRFNVAGDVAALFSSSTARAVVISALTTIGTFFSLSFSPHKGAASVGLLLTIAISVMLLVTFVVVPALLSVTNRYRRAT